MTDDLITDMQQTVNDARKQYGDDWELTSIHVKAGTLARLCELAEGYSKPSRRGELWPGYWIIQPDTDALYEYLSGGGLDYPSIGPFTHEDYP